MDVDSKAWDAFMSRRNGALLGVDIVGKYRDKYVWVEGMEFAMADFQGLSLFMAGVFTPRNPSYRNVILVDRAFLQEVDDKRGIAHQFFVKIDHRDSASKVAAAIDEMDFPVDLNAEPAQAALDQALDDLDDLLRYAGYVVVFTALTIFICITNSVGMSTYDRTQEIGVLRSLGFERPRVRNLVLLESILLSLIGGIVGCGAAYILLMFSPQDVSIRGVTVPIIMRPVMLGLGIAASLVVGVVGGLLPAIKASRLDIVASLRNVE